MTGRPSIYEHVGGTDGLTRFVAALHERCVADPHLEHPFTHAGLDPDHQPHLVAYLAEVFGGPTEYSTRLGGHSHMLDLHAGNGSDAAYTDAFVSCFMAATDDAALPDDAAFRDVWRRFVTAATDEVERVSPPGTTVAPALAMPRWDWDGPITTG